MRKVESSPLKGFRSSPIQVAPTTSRTTVDPIPSGQYVPGNRPLAPIGACTHGQPRLRSARAPAAPVTPNRRRVAGAAALASAVEWYDYFIFGIAAALILGDLYFPADNPTAGVLAAFATFAVGFLARPIGGIVAGQLGDKKGRKPMLVLALTMMGLATTGIGLLPTYETIGVAAPILLVLLRITQGIAVGAQWGGAMLLATEYAPQGKRGIYGSVVQLGVPIGVVTANSVFLAAGALTSDSTFASWGWRVPFLVGILVLGLAWYIHTRVEETPSSARPNSCWPRRRSASRAPRCARSCAATSAPSCWPAAPSPSTPRPSTS